MRAVTKVFLMFGASLKWGEIDMARSGWSEAE